MTTDSNTPDLSSVYVPLRLTFGLVPIAAGADKFFNLLTDWSQYLPSIAERYLAMEPSTFMMIIGVIEIVAGLAVLTAFTRMGAYVVMGWLLLIAVAVASAGFLDIAVRDVVMAIGAYALGQVAAIRGDQWAPGLNVGKGRVSHASAS